jgi:hypothetical protein
MSSLLDRRRLVRFISVRLARWRFYVRGCRWWQRGRFVPSVVHDDDLRYLRRGVTSGPPFAPVMSARTCFGCASENRSPMLVFGSRSLQGHRPLQEVTSLGAANF